MRGPRCLAGVVAVALATVSCQASNPAPEQPSVSPINTLAPTHPPKDQLPDQGAELLWRSSPFTGIAWPKDVAVADDGRIYVLDVSSDRIQTLSADGYITGSWGRRGAADGEFNFHDDQNEHIASTGGLVISGATVFVADSSRIQKFDLDGNFLSSWGTRGREPGQLLKTSHLAVGPEGNIYVLDTALTRVQVFTPEGQLVKLWRVPLRDVTYLSEMCVNPTGEMFIVEHWVDGQTRPGQPGVRIYKFSRSDDLAKAWGKSENGDGKLDGGEFGGGTSGIACDAQGRIYVPDEAGERVQVFDSDGGYLFSLTGPDGAKPTGPLAVHGDAVVATDTGAGSVFKFRLDS